MNLSAPFESLKEPEGLNLSAIDVSVSADDKITASSDKCDVGDQDETDAKQHLLTLRIWVQTSFPSNVITNLIEDESSYYDLVLQKHQNEFSDVLALLEGVRGKVNADICLVACKHGRTDFLEYFYKQGCIVTVQHLEAAAKYGHVGCLRYIYTLLLRGSNLSTLVNEIILKAAMNCSPGSLACVEYLLSVVPREDLEFDLVLMACHAGNVPALHFLVQQGFPIANKTAVTTAAEGGSLECLQYLHEELHFICYVPATMAAAAGAGQLELVKELHEKGCPWDESALQTALQKNQAECLEFLLLHHPVPKDMHFGWRSRDTSIRCHMVVMEAQWRELKTMMEDLQERFNHSTAHNIQQNVGVSHGPQQAKWCCGWF